MRNLLAILMLLITANAYAADYPKVERKQETVELGNSRFLIIAGEKNYTQFAYTADLVVLEKGVPHFDPLFTEEYDVDTNTVHLSEGIAFQAESYHFDKGAKTFRYAVVDADKQARFQYKYRLDGDILKLSEVLMQNITDGQPGTPKTIYKVK